MPKLLPYVLILISIIILIIVFIIYQSNKIIIKEYVIEDKKVIINTDGYKGIKIVYFSDLHIGKLLKKEKLKERLLMIKNLNANLYIFGGDLIGIDTIKHYTIEDIKECFEIFKDDETIAVLGNHEYKKVRNDFDKLKYFKAMGFKVLNDEQYISKDGLSIFGKQECIYHENVNVDKSYDLFLSHQGDVIDNYENQIILSGHTHGGQIRLPLIPIYYKPKYGKKYTSGLFNKNNSSLIVSNGLGFGGFKVRLFAPMDVVIIDYRK